MGFGLTERLPVSKAHYQLKTTLNQICGLKFQSWYYLVNLGLPQIAWVVSSLWMKDKKPIPEYWVCPNIGYARILDLEAAEGERCSDISEYRRGPTREV